MRKTLIIALILVSVCVSKPFEGYMVNYDKTGAIKFQKDSTEYDVSDLASFFKSNMGTLASKPTETAQKLIEKYGKGDLYSPLQMNYMFIIEGLNEIEQRRTQIANTVPISFENTKTEGSLIEDIFDELSEDSVVSSVNQYFGADVSRVPFYIYSSSKQFTDYFKYFGMTLNVNNNAQVDLYDTTVAKKYLISSNIEQCVNEVFDKQYALRAGEGYIYKVNTYNKLAINIDNIAEVEEFLKDVCGIAKLSKMFKKDSQPSFALFHVNSLAALKQKLNQEDYEFVLDAFTLLMKKATKNFEKKFPGNTLGQVLYVDEASQVAADKVGEMIPSVSLIELVQKQKKTSASRRTLTETYPNSTFDAATYSIFCWFSLVMVFVLAYTAISLYTMDIAKDTLLYAKFITTDK